MDVDGLLESISIVEYISQYVDLQEEHGDWFGVCPFHNDTDPSFSVTEDNGKWYCFGCHIGGSIVSFVMKYHHVNYDKAIEILCSYAGLTQSEIPKRLEATKTLKKYVKRDTKKKQSTYKILPEDYMSRYEKDWEKLALWENEGISREVMSKYQVRYCPFTNRIVFPIRTLTGGIMSISGRTLDPDYKKNKVRKYTYFQSLGTLDTLYAFSDHINSISEKHEIIIFEGVKSVLLAETWGITNTVAVLTNHLSDFQVRELIKLGARVVLAFDGGVNVHKDKVLPLLLKFVRVDWAKNRDGVLTEKMSPVDAGLEVWKDLYERRQRLN